jgi:hypothetical protein
MMDTIETTPTPSSIPTIDERAGRDVIIEALAIIDKSLGELMRRELVSTSEVTDLLLDVRSLLAQPQSN